MRPAIEAPARTSWDPAMPAIAAPLEAVAMPEVVLEPEPLLVPEPELEPPELEPPALVVFELTLPPAPALTLPGTLLATVCIIAKAV